MVRDQLERARSSFSTKFDIDKRAFPPVRKAAVHQPDERQNVILQTVAKRLRLSTGARRGQLT